MQVQNIPIDSVNALSHRDITYWKNSKTFLPYLSYDFEYSKFKEVINNRSNITTDRKLLHKVVKDQYSDIAISEITQNHIIALQEENCFAVTTAHQPSLMTGPLYYIYKILSTIKLTKRLRQDFPEYYFSPFFVIGGEDHDFEEINHFHLFNKVIEWKNQGKGSVGRLDTNGIEEAITEAQNILGSKSKAIDLINDIGLLAQNCKTYGDFSFKLTHLLFDHLGLVILRMDNPELKKAFIPIMEEEIYNSVSKPLVEAQQSKIENLGFANQAFARDINLFYLSPHGRNRIEAVGDQFKIVDTPLSFTKDSLREELHNHPERFSPNVVMRPLFQELIIPNLAYIGGGGELAYWTERKTQFQHFGMPFPMLIRRTSAIIISNAQEKQLNNLGFSIEDIFMDYQALIKMYIDNSDHPDYSLSEAEKDIQSTFKKIEDQVSQIDSTLKKTVQSELSKVLKSVSYLENKLKKSIKQKEEIQLNRIQKLKDKLFPSGLQERHDNIFEYISQYGRNIIDEMLDHCDPFDKTFKVFIKSKK